MIGILGAGSWGTALAILWARHGHQVTLWVRRPASLIEFREANCNTRYLPGHPFPSGISLTHDLAQVIAENRIICLAMPLQNYREFLERIRHGLTPNHRLIILSKGIEQKTKCLPHDIVAQTLGEAWRERTFTLSGPSFAKEVAQDRPTTVVLAGKNVSELELLQHELNCPTFRMYRNTDVIGVEMGAALKNVIAIAAGMVSGMKLGYNTLAGLITRGLSEIARMGVRAGAQRETFAGLAGMGDLILTCTGSLSRNLQVGTNLAKGKKLPEILDELGMVAEGVHTCRAAVELGHELDVDMPITNVVFAILYEGLPPREGLRRLMTRDLKPEVDEPS